MQIQEKKLVKIVTEDNGELEVLDTLKGTYDDLDIEVNASDVRETDMYVIRISKGDELVGAVDIDSCSNIYIYI